MPSGQGIDGLMEMSGILSVWPRRRSQRPILILMGRLELVLTQFFFKSCKTPCTWASLPVKVKLASADSTQRELITYLTLTLNVNSERELRANLALLETP